MTNIPTKDQLRALFELLEKHRVPTTPISYYTEEHDMTYFFDKDDRIVMMMSTQDAQDWLDMAKCNENGNVKE